MSTYTLHAALSLLVLTVVHGQTTVFPSNKVWWTKPITEDLYVAGRLSETQLKQAAEAGFKTIVAQYYWASDTSIGEEILPSTDNARYIVEELTGLPYHLILEPGDILARVETVEKFTDIYLAAEKPVLYYCLRTYTATYISLNYLANQTVSDPGFEPRVDSAELYERAALAGHYYSSLMYRQVVAAITGEPIVQNPPAPQYSISNWDSQYWLMKPVYENWYIAGQIRANYFPQIKNAGFESIINLRPGVTKDGEPSQDEVTLLNIPDGTGTYVGSGRQSDERLLETRMDPNKTNEYISPDSQVNYASRNYLEFGDDIGYNEVTESIFVSDDQGFDYYLTPFGGPYGFTRELFEEYLDTWMTVGQQDHALVHCSSAYRSAVMALLSAGYQYGLDCHWAVQRAKELGYHFDEMEDQTIVELFNDILC